MKLLNIVFVIASSNVLSCHAASSPCKKDSCYNAVAVQVDNGPNLAVRKADCSAVLRTRIEDDIKTITRTVSQTTIVATETITSTTYIPASTTISPVLARDRAIAEEQASTYAELEERDTFVVKGDIPKYAKVCKDLQAYSVACLCFGVKAAVEKALTVTRTTTKTISATKTETAFATTTDACPSFYNCHTGEGSGFCSDTDFNCGCVRTEVGNRCIQHGSCSNVCAQNSDCGAGYSCAFDTCCDTGVCLLEGCVNNGSPRQIFGDGARQGKSGGRMSGPGHRAQ